MILVDLNQVVISNLMVQINNYKQEAEEGLVKHMILNSILSIKKKFESDYGNIILCCDNKNFWRKDIFPHYKGNRKKVREVIIQIEKFVVVKMNRLSGENIKI